MASSADKIPQPTWEIPEEPKPFWKRFFAGIMLAVTSIITAEPALKSGSKSASPSASRVRVIEEAEAEGQGASSGTTATTPREDIKKDVARQIAVAYEEAEDALKATERTYIVEEGDSLWSIADREYGDGSRWIDIWTANRPAVTEPNFIRTGQELKIPVQSPSVDALPLGQIKNGVSSSGVVALQGQVARVVRAIDALQKNIANGGPQSIETKKQLSIRLNGLQKELQTLSQSLDAAAAIDATTIDLVVKTVTVTRSALALTSGTLSGESLKSALPSIGSVAMEGNKLSYAVGKSFAAKGRLAIALNPAVTGNPSAPSAPSAPGGQTQGQQSSASTADNIGQVAAGLASAANTFSDTSQLNNLQNALSAAVARGLISQSQASGAAAVINQAVNNPVAARQIAGATSLAVVSLAAQNTQALQFVNSPAVQSGLASLGLQASANAQTGEITITADNQNAANTAVAAGVVNTGSFLESDFAGGSSASVSLSSGQAGIATSGISGSGLGGTSPNASDTTEGGLGITSPHSSVSLAQMSPQAINAIDNAINSTITVAGVNLGVTPAQVAGFLSPPVLALAIFSFSNAVNQAANESVYSGVNSFNIENAQVTQQAQSSLQTADQATMAMAVSSALAALTASPTVPNAAALTMDATISNINTVFGLNTPLDSAITAAAAAAPSGPTFSGVSANPSGEAAALSGAMSGTSINGGAGQGGSTAMGSGFSVSMNSEGGITVTNGVGDVTYSGPAGLRGLSESLSGLFSGPQGPPGSPSLAGKGLNTPAITNPSPRAGGGEDDDSGNPGVPGVPGNTVDINDVNIDDPNAPGPVGVPGETGPPDGPTGPAGPSGPAAGENAGEGGPPGGSGGGAPGGDAGGSSASGGGGGDACVIAGTHIAMANGSMKDIQDIQIGDKVWGYERSVKLVAVEEVLRHDSLHHPELIVITTARSQIMLTAEHNVFTAEGWKRADSVQPGQPLCLLRAEGIVDDRVVLLERKETVLPLYTIRTASDNYFANGVLIHTEVPSMILDNDRMQSIKIANRI